MSDINSSDDESNNSSCSFKDGFNQDQEEKNSSEYESKSLMSRCVIHLDIDYFYCQCEEILNPSLASKPFAIGQKHIIVTANYVARRLGVKKLMGRTDALRLCPALTIIEGSDLEKYRMASREVYDQFRHAVKSFGEENLVKRGYMDEMFADITHAVNSDAEYDTKIDESSKVCQEIYIYGDNYESSVVKISEDQSGAEATICNYTRQDNQRGRYSGEQIYWGDKIEQQSCVKNLGIASRIAIQICDRIRSKTKFSTTVGISVSPMLAKLSSDIKKPNAVNILYPWRSDTIILNMPLRRIPGLGSKTYSVLSSCLETYYNSSNTRDFWTCRDLIKVPRNEIITALTKNESFQKNCEQQCDMILNRCRGIDNVSIVDDDGSLAKTVSVEGSFIRGSITSVDSVREQLKLLYERLLRLLDQRKQIAVNPNQSYPMSIRVSLRFVDQNFENSGRRPFRTVSKQQNFNGKKLWSTGSNDERKSILSNSALPLLQRILNDSNVKTNVTRLNLAVTSFADSTTQSHCEKQGQKHLANYFSSGNSIRKSTHATPHYCIKKKHSLKRESVTVNKKAKVPIGIDPTVFASLPADIAREVVANHSFHRKNSAKKKAKGGIQAYFTKN